MNAPPESAQCVEVTSTLKGELVLSDGRFVTLFKPTVGHYIVAYDKASGDFENAVRMVHITTLIDGRQPSMSELASLPIEDFSKVVAALMK